LLPNSNNTQTSTEINAVNLEPLTQTEPVRVDPPNEPPISPERKVDKHIGIKLPGHITLNMEDDTQNRRLQNDIQEIISNAGQGEDRIVRICEAIDSAFKLEAEAFNAIPDTEGNDPIFAEKTSEVMRRMQILDSIYTLYAPIRSIVDNISWYNDHNSEFMKTSSLVVVNTLQIRAGRFDDAISKALLNTPELKVIIGAHPNQLEKLKVKYE
jgi:hypothetical protein